MKRWALAIAAAALASGCSCAHRADRFQLDPTDDAGAADAEMQMPQADAGTDAGVDAGPICVPGCGEGHCVDGECVECRDSNDCPADRGQCVKGACEGCTQTEQCMARTDGNLVCHAGSMACVECSADEGSCATGETCNVASHTCVEIPIDSQEVCEPCTNDVQCAGDAKCIPLEYMGTPHAPEEPGSGYCLISAVGTICPRPYTTVLDRDTLNGAGVGPYCGINEELTTCEAILALIALQPCTGDTDAECPEGGICRLFPGLGYRCTYACSGYDRECLDRPNEDTCRAGEGAEFFCGP